MKTLATGAFTRIVVVAVAAIFIVTMLGACNRVGNRER
jgi:hypothetical protein